MKKNTQQDYVLCAPAGSIVGENTYEEIRKPKHYESASGVQAWDTARDWGLDKCAYKFNIWKYLSRMGRKPGVSSLKDARKLKEYADHLVEILEKEEAGV